METYILKFSACLFVFWLVYVLFLERQNMHRFKRFYLLGALVLALVIPTLTIIEYIEPVVTSFETAPVYFANELDLNDAPIEAPFFNLETILWLIYGLGVLLFSSRFIINLIKMQRRITKNENISKRSFIYVLLEANLIPHSFFRYIFFNKARYESHHIPKEVVLHEETHARQLHSLDIICLELLQIAFWFHPLLYILKHHVKLNHEFLADQAVLQQGSDAKTYQTILLQFSSNTQEYQLSSAINYSSIKKRFTVMKTQTSKTRIWLSTLLVLPIIALLFYNFAERVEVVQEESYTIEHVEHIKNELKKAEALQIHFVDKNSVEIYLKKYDIYEALRTTKPHYIHKSKEEQKELDNLFSDLGSLYFRMSKENKAKIKRPISAIKPFIKITLNSKTYYKKYNELSAEELATLSPPPPAPSTNQNNNYNFQEKPIMIILVNRKGQLLVDDELGTIESIESNLKKLSKSFDKSRAVYVKYDPSNASDQVLKDVKNLIRKYNFKIIFVDASQDAPQPPPPPVKQQKSKGGPNTNDSHNYPIPPPIPEDATPEERKKMQRVIDDFEKKYKRKVHSAKTEETGETISFIVNDDVYDGEQTQSIIKPIEILIIKDNSIILNNKPIKFKNLANTIAEINEHLTIDERRNYVLASILVEENESIDFAKKVQAEIRKADIWSSSISYLQNQKNAGLSANKLWTSAGLTVQEAKEKREKIFTDQKNSEQNKEDDKVSPWSIETEVTYVEYVEDSEQKQGPIEIDGKTYYYSVKKGKTTYYNRFGKEVELENLPLQKPSNPSFLEYIVDMEKQGASFYLDNKKITAKEAKSIATNNKGKSTEMLSQLDDNGKYVVKLSSPKEKKVQESILPMVNGKTIESGLISMTRDEIKVIIITTKNGKITDFKLKIPGIKTELVKGNTITKTTLKNLLSAKTGDYITLFDIKDDKGSKFLPIAIEIIENP